MQTKRTNGAGRTNENKRRRSEQQREISCVTALQPDRTTKSPWTNTGFLHCETFSMVTGISKIKPQAHSIFCLYVYVKVKENVPNLFNYFLLQTIKSAQGWAKSTLRNMQKHYSLTHVIMN